VAGRKRSIEHASGTLFEEAWVACNGGHVQMKVAVMKREILRDSELFGCQDGIIVKLVGTAFLSGRNIKRSVQICHVSKRMAVGGLKVSQRKRL
jgi:hypothetical protein